MLTMVICVIVGILLERILHVTDKIVGWINHTASKN